MSAVERVAAGGPPEARPVVTITYCTQCNWLLRAAWTAQELLTTFAAELGGVTLVPGTGGVFRVNVGAGDRQVLLWDRSERRGFPELGELKRAVRDEVAPDRPLGHTDRAASREA